MASKSLLTIVMLFSERLYERNKVSEAKELDHENNHKIKINECWSFNSCNPIFSFSTLIREEKPDAVLISLQFMKFGDKKIPSALALFF